MKRLIFIMLISQFCLAQNNWKVVNDPISYNSNATDSVWRSGPVAISHSFISPFNNRLLVTEKYGSANSRAFYASLNEPGSGDIGLGTSESNESHNVMAVNHYANFQSEKTFSDVHTSTAEFNFFRGTRDLFGFDDGGHLNKAAVLKVAGNFGKNNKSYSNTEFDLINLRFFTSDSVANPATISNFYALRMEDFRGINTGMIDKGWGIFIKPTILNNYFGGKVGIGTQAVSHPLTIVAAGDPVKFVGLQNSTSDNQMISIDNDGVLHKKDTQQMNENFIIITGDVTLTENYFLYIHQGPEATYTLPAANTRTGKTWKIVNTGSGSIIFTLAYLEGSELRNTLLNKPGNYSIELFSDGTKYIAIK